MNKEKIHHKPRVGISIGDVNGIGLEVILKTFADNRMLEVCTPVIYASSKIVLFHKKALNISDFIFTQVKSADDIVHKKINLVECILGETKIELGSSTKEAGAVAIQSLKLATEDLASNKTDVLVTAPINKNNVQDKDFNFPGHTEYLANYANEENPLMLMVADNLRVGVVTGHIPLKDVASAISVDKIVTKLKVLNKTLIQDFKIQKPRIAVLGLNPHAGDKGTLGHEEEDVILPAVQKAKKEGIFCFGPYAADGIFGSPSLKDFDAVLAMYHDQGLAPFKALAFNDGVNFTAGLPIVRTSPDHGTAYDIAGKNMADESSFRKAVYLACDIYETRKEHKILTANPLVAKATPKFSRGGIE